MSIIRQLICTVRAKINPISYARRIGVKVGAGCRFFSLHPGAFGSEPFLVSIGNNVTITAGVRFVTHDGSVYLFRDTTPRLDVFGPISIGDNSFLGMNSIIMPGVSIGRNCVVGAMSLVTSSVPDGTVVAGNPARPLFCTDTLRMRLMERSLETGQMSFAEKRKLLETAVRFVDSKGKIWLRRDAG
jgi:acetyltransferase-like isoleucine patch superfamily enzyme